MSLYGKIRAYLWSYPGSSTDDLVAATGEGRRIVQRMIQVMVNDGDVVVTEKGLKLGSGRRC